MTDWAAVLVGLAAMVLSAAAGWPLTAAVLDWAARTGDALGETSPEPAPEATRATGDGDGDRGTEPDAPTADGAAPPPPRAVLRGGAWIGLLERLAVTGSIAAGYPEGVAFVIAVKGLGRYPELREHPGLSERFVIGTLASLGWAALCGAAVRGLVGGLGG